MWYPYEDGKTIGTVGSEDGTIVKDEEFLGSARITLERDGHTPYGITCGIYGCMVHTVFASTQDEAEQKYEAMKCDIADAIIIDATEDEICAWCADFTSKY